jgi:TatD DNase family protein
LLVDSHCHLNYLDDPSASLAVARSRGVGEVLCIGVGAEHIDQVLNLAESEVDVWASVGQHPQSAIKGTDWIEPHLNHPRVVAVGETGLDYLHQEDPPYWESWEIREVEQCQRDSFSAQLTLAQRFGLPVVVHTRAAQQDTLALMREHAGVLGVLHCFTESWEMASQALDLGYYISISGIVTFPNGDNVREVAKRVPIERLLVETDAPWLAPVPHRGQQNQPAFVCDTAEFLAELRGLSLEALAETTSANFRTLFNRTDPGTPLHRADSASHACLDSDT